MSQISGRYEVEIKEISGRQAGIREITGRYDEAVTLWK